MKRYLSECFGTFILVFCGTGAIIINDVIPNSVTHIGIGMTFGLVVMAMIYTVGEISGAHFNPAVTLGFWISKRFPTKELIPYIGFQCIGAIAASLLLKGLFMNHQSLGMTIPNGPLWTCFIVEIILTFILMFVILNVATGSKETGIMAGIAIGGVVGLEALFAGPLTGASMNPARSLAPALVSGNLQHVWLYIAAPCIGSLVAVYAYCGIREDCCPKK